MGLSCFVLGCRSSPNQTPDLTFHCVPAAGHRAAQWLKVIGRRECQMPNHYVQRVCSKHFTRNDFQKGDKLKVGAVPSRHLPAPSPLPGTPYPDWSSVHTFHNYSLSPEFYSNELEKEKARFAVVRRRWEAAVLAKSKTQKQLQCIERKVRDVAKSRGLTKAEISALLSEMEKQTLPELANHDFFNI